MLQRTRPLAQSIRAYSASSSEPKTKIKDGPSFADFVSSGSIHEAVAKYHGKLKLEKGDRRLRLPDWLKKEKVLPSENENVSRLKKQLKGLKLATVCEEARFCSVKTSRKPPPLDPLEPEKTALAVKSLAMYITSLSPQLIGRFQSYFLVYLKVILLEFAFRDDVEDGGASHLSKTVQLMKKERPELLIECLLPDFAGCIRNSTWICMALSGLDVYAHNVETVERLTPWVRDPRAKYHQSLAALKRAKTTNPKLITKTSIMLGLGEQDDEVRQCLADLRSNDVDVVTFGQYMQPTKRHLLVKEWVTPQK
ncbi:putative lipoyl synthase [Cooperia oncophora]